VNAPLLFTIERGGVFGMYYVEQNLTMTKNRKHYEMMYDRTHTLVKLEKVMDWGLVYRYIKPFYSSHIGRPTIDPRILVKILLIQYIEGF
jgi:transposase